MFRGSIVALITPFRNGSVDEAAFKDIIEWQLSEGTDGFVPVGTTGESPTLSHAEHERVIELCIETVAGRVPVIAGAGSNSTEEAISLTSYAQKAGADAALIVTPYYNKPTQRGMIAHYTAIHDATDIPIIIYNIPGRSVVDMSAATMGELAKLPRIAGVKDSTADIVRPLETYASCGADFAQLSGEDGNILAFMAHGGHGCISVTANVVPGLCAKMHDAWAEGRLADALALHRQMLPLHQGLFCESNPAPAKYLLSRANRCTDEVRLPLVSVGEQSRALLDLAYAKVMG